jgi:hypothetical protein
MNGAEKVVKHLEMTQAVINHLGSNSLLVKSWSMTIIVAAMVLIGKQDIQSPYFSWCLFFPSWDFGRGPGISVEVMFTFFVFVVVYTKAL